MPIKNPSKTKKTSLRISKNTRFFYYLFSSFVVMLLADRLFKYLALKNEWTGSFFVLSKNQVDFLAANNLQGVNLGKWISVFLIFALVGYIYTNFKKWSLEEFAGWTLVLLGGVSNTLDRSFYQFVIDYLKIFSLYFNLADIYIIAGAGIIFYLKFIRKTKPLAKR